jgi:hypothetical protein
VDTTVLIIIIVVLLIALAAAGVLLSRRRQSERLQEHYGPEYERSVRESGDRRKAEAQLTEREKRVKELDIRELRPEERDRFSTAWSEIQRGFVDDPVKSVRAADGLVVDIMRTRGYPVDDFERRAEDVSVEHPDVVHHYREARAIKDATDHGTVDTDQQRKAVTSYRSLVEALLGQGHGDDRRSDDRRDDVRHSDDRQDVRSDNGRSDDRRPADDRSAEGRHYADDARTDPGYNDDAPTDRRYADDPAAGTRPTDRPNTTEEHTR